MISTLLLFLPPRSRLRAPGRPAAGEALAAGEYDYVFSADGKHVGQQGRLPAAQLPDAELVIAFPDESDLSWQRVTLPRAGRQLRAALAGMLEEALLDDPENLHFAVEPEAIAGSEAWVAVSSREWLAQQLAALEAAQVFVDRLAPLSWPEAPPRGHFYETGSTDSPAALRWSHPGGVSNLALQGGLTRQLFPPAVAEAAQWSAAPAVAAQAEQWLGSTVTVLTREQRALAAIEGPWNLRQFELAQRTRGLRTLRNAWRTFMQRNWRPVRWGLIGLVAVQLVGMNAMALQQRHQLQQRKDALNTTLTTTYPQIRVPLNAPVQMRRETDTLRATAGRAGPQDLETLLAAAAGAWPQDRGPVDAMSFEAGRLVMSAAGWSDDQIQRLRSQLRSEGWQLDSRDGQLTLQRPAEQRGPKEPTR